MGRAFNVQIPASGLGSVPISVSGDTYFSGLGGFQIAYDEQDFGSNQFALLSVEQGTCPIFCFPPNTILWVRLDPTAGVPETTLNVLTQIKTGAY
jgi:hypothetical protein